MTWGTITVGGLAFRETLSASEASGKLALTGQESSPPQAVAAVHAVHLNVLGLQGTTVPIVPTDKTELTGYYTVTDGQSDLLNVAHDSVVVSSWQLGLTRLGTERDVEFESRIPLVARSTELAGVSAVFWHAPPPAASSYYTGATVPAGTVTRQSAEGAVTVYTGLPTVVAPRWTCPAAGYMAGSARVLLDGIQRAGLQTAASSSWEVSNGLVQVTGSGASLTVSAWSGTAWVSAKGYTPTVAGAALTGTPEVTLLRNDPEQVTIRLSYPVAPGRVTVDLSLRRGSRFVTGVMKRQAAATLGVTRTAAEAASAVTGGLRATTVDTDGNRFVMGSSRTLTTTTTTATIAKASVTSLDFFLGHEIGGSPASGDAFANLLAQYLGHSGDRTRTVRR